MCLNMHRRAGHAKSTEKLTSWESSCPCQYQPEFHTRQNLHRPAQILPAATHVAGFPHATAAKLAGRDTNRNARAYIRRGIPIRPPQQPSGPRHAHDKTKIGRGSARPAPANPQNTPVIHHTGAAGWAHPDALAYKRRGMPIRPPKPPSGPRPAHGTIAIALAPRCEAANWIQEVAIESCNIFSDWRRGHELGSSGHPKTMGSL